MKLIIAVIRQDDFMTITKALVNAGFGATSLGSTGAYLDVENATILSCVEDDDIEDALDIIRKNARTHNYEETFDPKGLANISGTVVFVTDVVHFERLGKSKNID